MVARAIQPTLRALERKVFASSHASSTQQAGARGISRAPFDPAAAARYHLTVRELQALDLLAWGFTADVIGRLMRISTRTVHKHLEHVYGKLDCHDRLVVVRQAAGQGLLGHPQHEPACVAFADPAAQGWGVQTTPQHCGVATLLLATLPPPSATPPET